MMTPKQESVLAAAMANLAQIDDNLAAVVILVNTERQATSLAVCRLNIENSLVALAQAADQLNKKLKENPDGDKPNVSKL